MKVEDKTVVVAACYKTTSLTLANDEPNEPLLSKSLYNIYDVSLNDRMLYRNGDWNTLCLPFDLKDFIGTFSPVTIGKEGENTLLYLGADKTLYWPNREIIIGCQRAYIQLNGITAGDLAETRLNFGNGETTEMTTTRFANDTNPDGAWYDLSGRRLSGKPSRAGVYINNSTAKRTRQSCQEDCD